MNSKLKDFNFGHRICDFKEEASKLIETRPPKLFNRKKKFVYNNFSSGKKSRNNIIIPFDGTIEFFKYHEIPLAKSFKKESKLKVISKENFYDYEETEKKDNDAVDWWVNFADKNLFGFYYGPLLAQDELMVLEMPILASVKEYLGRRSMKDRKYAPLTVENGRPTPCLVKNVQRRVELDVHKHGIYGNKFQHASNEVIQDSTTIFKEPKMVNVLAMEAAKLKSGRYNRSTIQYILSTAHTGFRAVKVESGGDEAFTVVHTGWWGCGAFGGCKEIMAVVQIAAAILAGLDQIVFHVHSSVDELTKAMKTIEDFDLQGKTVTEFIEMTYNKNYQWGFSDGN